jgi:predicted O-linked N-acetylglucosamine transferase (SPINDLY family)
MSHAVEQTTDRAALDPGSPLSAVETTRPKVRRRKEDRNAPSSQGTPSRAPERWNNSSPGRDKPADQPLADLRTVVQIAEAHELAGRLELAASVYRQALAVGPASPLLWFRLGNVEFSLHRWAEASEAFERAAALSPSLVEARHCMGEVARMQGDLQGAVRRYREALAVRPDFSPSRNNLAVLLMTLGEYGASIEHFEAAAQSAPQAPEPRANLAICLAAVGRFDEALAKCDEARRLSPGHPLVHETFGRIHHGQGRLADARAAFVRALEIQPGNFEVRRLLGELDLVAGDVDRASESFVAAARLRPDFEPAWTGMARTAELADDVEAATAIYRRIASRSGRGPLWKLRAACACPTIFESERAIDVYRESLLAALGECSRACGDAGFEELLYVGLAPPFNLQFHGRDDRRIKEAFGTFTAARLGEDALRRTERPPRDRPRVGFVSLRNESAFVRSIGGLIAQLDPDALEPVVVGLGSGRSTLERAFAATDVERMYLPARPAEMLAALRSARFDVLYYFEIGTSPLGYLLPAHRLAPVQCTSWGVQTTSGLLAIDAYISSLLIEPDDAAAAYSEKLVLLGTMLSWQTRPHPAAVPGRRLDEAPPADRRIYLCPQQLGKLTPAFDDVLRRILLADPSGVVAITEGTAPVLVGRLRERFRSTLQRAAERVVFLPQQTGEAYFRMLASAHVLLDPIAFGGVNTTYDAFAVGKAVVTLPSGFQRGRYTLGCYRMMELDACVANSTDDYVAKAVRIATDADLRRSLEASIRERSQVLFENRSSVEELQRTLLELAAGAGERGGP